MALDDYSYDIDTTEWLGNSQEKVSALSEKFKESIKKASSWIARTQKDEKKSQKIWFFIGKFFGENNYQQKIWSCFRKYF